MKERAAAWMKKWKYQLIFLGVLFILLSVWALLQPFKSAPDEGMRYQIPEYIFNYHKLPDGRDELLRNEKWGISYGFGPPLTYILQAVFMGIIQVISDSKVMLIFGARMVSVCAGIGTIWMTMLISEKLFDKKWRKLFVALVGLLPQVLYLSTYVNNDALALFGTSVIVYMWICGLESGWKYSHCIGLALGIAVCTLTYFNSYGFILCSIPFLFGSLFLMKKPLPEIAKKSLLIAGLVLILSAWFFVRNYLLYDGDFLGMSTSDRYAELYAVDALKPSLRETPYNTGMGFGEMFFGPSGWFAVTWRSFVGVFGWMATYMSHWQYFFYAFLFWIGGAGLLLRKKKTVKKTGSRLFTGTMAVAMVIPVALSLYNSYFTDYQPQGRYIMPMLIPFMYFVTKGVQNVAEHILKPEKVETFISVITAIMAGIAIYAYIVLWFGTNRLGLNYFS